jgi:hypothetical protein
MPKKQSPRGDARPPYWEKSLKREIAWGEVKVQVKIWDEPGDIEDHFIVATLFFQMEEGETEWQTKWKHLVAYLKNELKPYLDQWCPAPKEMYQLFLESLPPEIKENWDKRRAPEFSVSRSPLKILG